MKSVTRSVKLSQLKGKEKSLRRTLGSGPKQSFEDRSLTLTSKAATAPVGCRSRNDPNSGSEVVRKKEVAKKPPVNEGAIKGETSASVFQVLTSKYPTSEGKEKTPKSSAQDQSLEDKHIQCNLGKLNEDTEVSLPNEIKALLINVTFLLHELKSGEESKKCEELCDIISKISTLLTELSRRPIKKIEELPDYSKPFEGTADNLASVLKEYEGSDTEQYKNIVKDIASLRQLLAQREYDVKYVKEQILEERSRWMSEPRDVEDCLRSSILKNMSLKAEIKYNAAQFKKYEKILAQKEKVRQKMESECNVLRRKLAKLVRGPESSSKFHLVGPSNLETETTKGGSLVQHIKTNVPKVKKIGRRSVAGRKVIHSNKT